MWELLVAGRMADIVSIKIPNISSRRIKASENKPPSNGVGTSEELIEHIRLKWRLGTFSLGRRLQTKPNQTKPCLSAWAMMPEPALRIFLFFRKGRTQYCKKTDNAQFYEEFRFWEKRERNIASVEGRDCSYVNVCYLVLDLMSQMVARPEG